MAGEERSDLVHLCLEATLQMRIYAPEPDTQSIMKPIRFVITALVVATLGAAYWRFAPQHQRDRAYRICATCGLSDSEVDGLVAAFTGATPSRAELLDVQLHHAKVGQAIATRMDGIH